MSATIRSTVETALSNAGVPTSSYTSYINTVVAALEEREFIITETVVEETAKSLGASTNVVAERVKELTNLEFRPIPEPVVVEEPEAVEAYEDDSEGATKSGGKGKRIAALEESVAGLVASVNKLTALAERHLGA